MFEIPFIEKFLASAISSNGHLNDAIDRLHHEVTVAALIFCAMFVGAKQQFGHPIQCMLPAHLDRSSWASYGQYYCFIESTYRLTYNKTLPSASARLQYGTTASVNYYQWVPFLLAAQAMCFFIPGWFWTTLQNQQALDMETVVEEAISLKVVLRAKDRAKKLEQLVEYVASSLQISMNIRRMSKNGFRLGAVNGLSLAIYLVSKFLTTANDLLQLTIIGHFIGIDGLSWTPAPLGVGKRDVEIPFASPYFPRVTFCDMKRQTMGGVELNTLQCVLMLNFINEKIFFMLWYWISMLLIGSLANFVITLVLFAQGRHREILVNFYLQTNETDKNNHFFADQKILPLYINEFIGLDGLLLIHFIHNHAGDIVARDVTVALWQYFCKNSVDSSPKNVMDERSLKSEQCLM